MPLMDGRTMETAERALTASFEAYLAGRADVEAERASPRPEHEPFGPQRPRAEPSVDSAEGSPDDGVRRDGPTPDVGQV
jgi:hypothetical protein